MEDKIRRAMQIISGLNSDYNERDYYSACAAILDTGLTSQELKNYVDTHECGSLTDMGKGDMTAAANYIWNMLVPGRNVSFCLDQIYEFLPRKMVSLRLSI